MVWLQSTTVSKSVFDLKIAKRCVAAGCSNERNLEEGISLHKLPFYSNNLPEAKKRRKKCVDFVRLKRAKWEPSQSSVLSGRKKAGWGNGQSALGPMCDAEKDWHERSFRASGEINGCKNFLSTNRKSTFLSLFLSHQWRIFKSLLDALDPKCNTFMSAVMMLK